MGLKLKWYAGQKGNFEIQCGAHVINRISISIAIKHIITIFPNGNKN